MSIEQGKEKMEIMMRVGDFKSKSELAGTDAKKSGQKRSARMDATSVGSRTAETSTFSPTATFEAAKAPITLQSAVRFASGRDSQQTCRTSDFERDER